jgi:hypothetical protein
VLYSRQLMRRRWIASLVVVAVLVAGGIAYIAPWSKTSTADAIQSTCEQREQWVYSDLPRDGITTNLDMVYSGLVRDCVQGMTECNDHYDYVSGKVHCLPSN